MFTFLELLTSKRDDSGRLSTGSDKRNRADFDGFAICIGCAVEPTWRKSIPTSQNLRAVTVVGGSAGWSVP
jgi:hypothetical protein